MISIDNQLSRPPITTMISLTMMFARTTRRSKMGGNPLSPRFYNDIIPLTQFSPRERD
jgi:hypothetical protein